MTAVIFTPDNQGPYALALLRSLFIGHPQRTGHLIPVIGAYNGKAEFGFIANYADFINIIMDGGFVGEQESVLTVTACNKQYATLWFNDGQGKFFTRESGTKALGSLKQVSKTVALDNSAWTFRPDINAWFITAHDNPDRVPPQEGWNSDYIRIPKEEAVLYGQFKQSLRAQHELSLNDLPRHL